DDMWQTRVDQNAVDSIRINWDIRTPANPAKGIYQTDVDTFGDPPNVDGDPKIIILILNIDDGFSGSGGYIAGYFFGINESADGSLGALGHRSNFAEIYYVDANPLNLKTANGITTGMQTAAHEFQHMIHYNYDPNEIAFVNEACSQVAELVCGYPYTGQNLYTDNTDIYLIGWNSLLADYSRGQRWMLYMWNQFPNDYLKRVVQEQANGIDGMNNALAAYGTARRFDDIFIDWLIANQVQNASADARYDYSYVPTLLKPKTVATYVNPNTGSQSGFVTGLGADYIAFTGGSNLSVTFNSAFTNMIVKAVKTGPGITPVVQDVPKSTPYNEPAFGTTYTNITFIVINTLVSTGTNSYGYSATGTSTVTSTELKWDNSEPIGYLRWAPLDTVCVIFDAVPGARLDSIRVALRRAGTMNGGVWRFTGAQRPTPLGSRLAFPIVASTNFTTPLAVNPPNPVYPYPIPYPNWVTVDLRSYNIMLDQPFAVGFWQSADTSQDAYVMQAKHTSGDFYNSYTYGSGSSGERNWWYFTSSGDGLTYLHLIRAYAGYGPAVSTPPIELLPTSFALRQNYPNPFNPSTRIRYALPERSHVRLEIVDMLGRVVAKLVDGEQSAGAYETEWDGKNLSGSSVSSGVYFYRLESGSFREIKRMVLLK
ncbi:MAG TPA: FlgD immunoglobulin-like domain containing protein, partial [Bacteroidota bacterium]